MNKTATILTALSLLVSTAAMAQNSKGQLQPRIAPAAPVAPVVPPPAVKKDVAASAYSTEMAEHTLRRAREENRILDKKAGPQLKNADGLIRIDFGIAKQGESFSTFFPFNIATLEKYRIAEHCNISVQ